jgi:hypothetical protein
MASMEPQDLMPMTEADEPLEAWTPDEFDHFTDFGLLRPGLSADTQRDQ